MNSNRLSNVTVALPSGEGFGWGVCGSNLAKRLSEMGASIRQSPAIGVDQVNGPCLQAIGSHEFGYTANIIGQPQIGYGFIENDILAVKYGAFGGRIWDMVISGSTWMRDSMMEIRPSSLRWLNQVVIQGVDTDIFNYKPENTLKDTFTIGSFGKFERRKGQDVVIRAVKLFKQRHKDVRLLHAWHNPWPQIVQREYPGYTIEVIANGDIYRDLLVKADLGDSNFSFSHMAVRQEELACLYSLCDVALFPNRCEAGTNLCLMEALACGLPCIAADATGHRDITSHPDYPCDDLSLVGGKQYVQKLEGIEIGHWVEPCIEEVLSQLEYAYRQRDELKARRPQISQFGMKFTWDKSAEKMASLLQ